LLPSPARSAANYRTYEGEHLRHLSFIRRARELGFSIDQVRELMGLADSREQSCIAVDVIANQHRDAITRKIADLTALAGELDALIDSCSRNTVADCRIIEALAPKPISGSGPCREARAGRDDALPRQSGDQGRRPS
jgi:DNA-binding transcriptional MerR regulator